MNQRYLYLNRLKTIYVTFKNDFCFVIASATSSLATCCPDLIYLRGLNLIIKKKLNNMKRFAFSLLASGILFLAACTNQGSSTVATRDDDETATPAKEQEHEATTGERDQTTTAQKDTSSAAADTTHTAGTTDSTHMQNQHK
jgi:hypothetical protein